MYRSYFLLSVCLLLCTVLIFFADSNIAGESMCECSEKKEKHGDFQFGVLGVGIRNEDRASEMF